MSTLSGTGFYACPPSGSIIPGTLNFGATFAVCVNLPVTPASLIILKVILPLILVHILLFEGKPL